MPNWAERQVTVVVPGTPRPIDPRARRVAMVERRGNRHCTITFECGHTVRRKLFGCSDPKVMICYDCPSAGGLGNHLAARRRASGTSTNA
jgi:hypothetical protein